MVQDYILSSKTLWMVKKVWESWQNFQEKSFCEHCICGTQEKTRADIVFWILETERERASQTNYISVWGNPFRVFKEEEKEHEATACVISGQFTKTTGFYQL